MAYILESRARLDDPSYSAPLITIYFKLGRTRSQTQQQAHGPPAPVQAAAAPTPVQPATHVPAHLPAPIATIPTPIPTVLAPAISTPTRPTVYDLTIPSPPATPPSPPSPPYEPSIWIQTSKPESQMEIKRQIVEVRRELKNYYGVKPMNIDLTRYPEYPSLPTPYQRLTAYMHKHEYGVPEDWQNLETPYGLLPLGDLRNDNDFTRCAPKLRNFRTFAQIDECDSYCRHDRWPYDLVVAVQVPGTCRCCNDKINGRYWVLSLAHGTGCVPTCN